MMNSENEQGDGKAAVQQHTPDIDHNNRITKRLCELYDSVREETIPDRFLDLLEQLDEAEKSQKRRSGK